MMRFLACQNTVPYKFAPCVKWLLLLVSIPITEFQLATKKNAYSLLTKLMTSLVQLHTQLLWTSDALPSASQPVLFPFFVFHCFLSILSAIIIKKKPPKLNRKDLFVLIFCLGTKREWAHHWEGMATDTQLPLEKLIQKREWQ